MGVHSTLIVGLAVALVAGCVPAARRDQPLFGNQVGDTGPAVMSETLVADSVAEIMSLYPASATGFYFVQATPDDFGQGLTAALRAQGYQVLERQDVAGPHLPPGLQVAYVVDVPAGLNLYRVTLFIGPESLSRGYVPTATGALAAAGPWSRRQ